MKLYVILLLLLVGCGNNLNVLDEELTSDVFSVIPECSRMDEIKAIHIYVMKKNMRRWYTEHECSAFALKKRQITNKQEIRKIILELSIPSVIVFEKTIPSKNDPEIHIFAISKSGRKAYLRVTYFKNSIDHRWFVVLYSPIVYSISSPSFLIKILKEK